MKSKRVLNLIIGLLLLIGITELKAQIGYYDAPYTRYEADLGTVSNATILPKSYAQSNLQCEASDQICVTLSNSTSSSVSWNATANGNGLVVRYSIPDGTSAALTVYANGVSVGTLNLSTYYSWEYLMGNSNPNDAGIVNPNPRMRFDEVRMILPSMLLAGQTLKLVWQSGNNISIDFAELEVIPPAVTASGGDVTYDGSGLQNFVNNHGGQSIYLPAGTYNINSTLWFGVNNTTFKGAGIWYTEIHFTNNSSSNQAGLWAQAYNISFSNLYLSTVGNSRSNNSKAINGVFTSTSTITNIWAEHFECGAWIAQYNFGSGPNYANGFNMSYCRFRNNYADGTNLCEGTSNAIVEHCSYRNNGDDDMAVWPASGSGQEGQYNTFRYNTSENSWRASGCAIYGGLSNQAHDLLIKDPLEVGIRVNNNFGGYAFDGGGMHQFYNIQIINGGTYNDVFNNPVGAIDLQNSTGAGNTIYNVTFSCITLTSSKNDAIYFSKTNGSGFDNFIFQNITINGTGAEYPNNNAGGGNGGNRGYGVLFWNYPAGYGTYCNMTFSGIGGNVGGTQVGTAQIGSFSWTSVGGCPGGCAIGSSTTMTSGTSFGPCTNPVTLTANTTASAGNTVSYVEFFAGGTSLGQDNTSPYSIFWNNPTPDNNQITAIAHYTPSNTTSTSTVQNVYIIGGIYTTASPPTIDGIAEASWNGYSTYTLTQGFNSPPSLGATFKVRYDATNLYVLVTVADNTPNTPYANNVANYWNDDAAEILIDCGNTKTSTYGANDFQYALVRNVGGAMLETKHSPGSLTGVVAAQVATALGYTIEVQFPWSTLGCSPVLGGNLGFDVKLNDDASGSGRTNQLAWNDGTFQEYNNPSLFGTLQFANCSNPLPVNLLSFTGEMKNETVALNWITSSEINNKLFVVERSSNLTHWIAIGDVRGAINSSAVSTYTFTDYSPLRGESYYRLVEVNINGDSTNSNVISVNTTYQSGYCNVMPNPFVDALTIQSSIKDEMEVTIYDMLGKIVYQSNGKSEDGKILLQPELPSGTYMISIKSATFIEQKKIIKM
jgi:hypothetical protein